MLDHGEYMPLNYIRMQRFSGSFSGMRFLMHREPEIYDRKEAKAFEEEGGEFQLRVVCWREPYSYEHTPKEEMKDTCFPLNEEGRQAAMDWLDAEYAAREAYYKDWKYT